ncbi:MAG: hypothetical protein ABIN80_28480 [Dyadobacter sp.]|uniref:hypothetical protein n=1 Tax=Dyadobacter sp. TaxID=1914288 RepID=UPI003267E649
MKALTIKRMLLLLVILTGCSDSNENPGNDPMDDDLAGPISRPTSGYGADGINQVEEVNFPNPLYDGTEVSIFYPSKITSGKPTVFFSHPYGGENKNFNKGLFEFIAKKGFVVVFVPYPTLSVSIEDRYNTLWAGFTKAAKDYPNLIDTTRVGFMGHSFGGGASIGLAYKAFTENGWGKSGRFLFTMAPWYSFQITPEQLANFPTNTQMITQVYDQDVVNDSRMAIDIFKSISIEANEKDFVYIRSSTVDGYTYLTDHVLPNTRSAYDALDYYGIYRLLDALMDYSFNHNAAARDVALGNGSVAQITMPSYNGKAMAPLEVTDAPSPQYQQGKYEFRCDSIINPRIDRCN